MTVHRRGDGAPGAPERRLRRAPLMLSAAVGVAAAAVTLMSAGAPVASLVAQPTSTGTGSSTSSTLSGTTTSTSAAGPTTTALSTTTQPTTTQPTTTQPTTTLPTVTPEAPSTYCDGPMDGVNGPYTVVSVPDSEFYDYVVVDNLEGDHRYWGGPYDFTVTATPADGFTFPDDAVSTWFFAGDGGCPITLPPTTVDPPPAPTTTDAAAVPTTTVPVYAPATCFRGPCGDDGTSGESSSGGATGGGSGSTGASPPRTTVPSDIDADVAVIPKPGPAVINPQFEPDLDAAIERATELAEVDWWFADEQLVQNVETTMTIQLNPLNAGGLAVDPSTGATSEPDPERQVEYGRKNRLQVRSRCVPEGSDNCDFDISPSDWQTNVESDLDWTVQVTPRKTGTLLLVIDVQPVVRVIGDDQLMEPINRQVQVQVSVNPAQDALQRTASAADSLIVSVPDEQDLVVGRPFEVSARFERPDATEVVTVALKMTPTAQPVRLQGGPSGDPTEVSSWSWMVTPTEAGALQLDFELVASARVGDRQPTETRTTSKQLMVRVPQKPLVTRLWGGLLDFSQQLQLLIGGPIVLFAVWLWRKAKKGEHPLSRLAFWRTGPTTATPPTGDAEPVSAATPSAASSGTPPAELPYLPPPDTH